MRTQASTTIDSLCPLALTPRETSILCLVAEGSTNAQAARKLHISRHTVAQHIAEMLHRTQASNRAELIARAYSCGILAIGVWPPSLRPAYPGDARPPRAVARQSVLGQLGAQS